jgi:ankyrin
VNLLLEANASPNTTSNTGQTALSIAQKLGYISVVETLKVVTDTVVTTTTTTTVEEKYKVLAPESMQETFMSDSEDEGGEGEEPTNDKSYQYLTTDDVLKMGDDTQMDVTAEEGRKTNSMSRSHHERGPVIDPAADSIEQKILQMEKSRDKPDFGHGYVEDKFAQSDNVNLSGPPIAAG